MRPTFADRIEHILTAINNIRRFVSGHSRETFANDLMLRLAVERSLEIISEASRFIPEHQKAAEPTINWRALSDLGNWLRHAYHRTDVDLLWSMVEDDLEPLNNFVERIARETKR